MPLAAATFEILVNGEPFEVVAGSTVADVLALRGLVGQRIAVERNGAIVPRSRHANTSFAPDDRVEIVVAVGGG
jgi:sulfur carrier protein